MTRLLKKFLFKKTNMGVTFQADKLIKGGGGMYADSWSQRRRLY